MKKFLSIMLAIILSVSCLTLVASAGHTPETICSDDTSVNTSEEYFDEYDNTANAFFSNFSINTARAEMDLMDIIVEITLIPFKVITFPFIFFAGFMAGLLGY